MKSVMVEPWTSIDIDLIVAKVQLDQELLIMVQKIIQNHQKNNLLQWHRESL